MQTWGGVDRRGGVSGAGAELTGGVAGVRGGAFRGSGRVEPTGAEARLTGVGPGWGGGDAGAEQGPRGGYAGVGRMERTRRERG